MLKKLAKRIEKELAQAEDYTEQTFVVMSDCPSTAELFYQLAMDEISHVEKLLKEGQKLIDDKKLKHYDKESDEHSIDECKIMWKWEHRVAMERVMECKFRLNQYKLI